MYKMRTYLSVFCVLCVVIRNQYPGNRIFFFKFGEQVRHFQADQGVHLLSLVLHNNLTHYL